MLLFSEMQTPFGRAVLYEKDGALIRFSLSDETPPNAVMKKTVLMQQAQIQLQEYFFGLRQNFYLPLAAVGTPFQQKVWQALRTIPYGQTASYAEIAARCGNPKACRAVGMANHRNPLWILIPCHRVVGKNGTLTGYACGLAVKQALLNLEKA